MGSREAKIESALEEKSSLSSVGSCPENNENGAGGGSNFILKVSYIYATLNSCLLSCKLLAKTASKQSLYISL